MSDKRICCDCEWCRYNPDWRSWGCWSEGSCQNRECLTIELTDEACECFQEAVDDDVGLREDMRKAVFGAKPGRKENQ